MYLLVELMSSRQLLPICTEHSRDSHSVNTARICLAIRVLRDTEHAMNQVTSEYIMYIPLCGFDFLHFKCKLCTMNQRNV